MSEERTNIIDMTDTDGNIVQFEHLLTFEYGENFYVGLLPVEPIEGMVVEMSVYEDEVGSASVYNDGSEVIFYFSGVDMDTAQAIVSGLN